MTIWHVDKNAEAKTMVITAEFRASITNVWQLWADPRLLEQWWGPPSYPATFERLELEPGGEAAYFMTGPEGDRHRGWWRVTSVDAPKSIEFVDGFADSDGNPVEDMPVVRMHMQIAEHEGRTRMELRSFFASREDLERLDGMAMAEGLRAALGQMDALLAA